GLLKLVGYGKASGEGFYWRYETAIKKLESELHSVIGANGAIYAVRSKLLAPLPLSTINDDFINSMRVIEQGYGVKYAPDAIAYEEATFDDSVEFKRHVRDGAGHYRAMIHLYRLLNPLRCKTFFLYVSHKVIRWFVPFYLILMLIIPLFNFLDPLIRRFYYVQLVFYLLVLIGWVSGTKIKIFYVPFYFIYINIALLIGFIKNIVGAQKVAWSSTAR
ncbi:MAG: glycosyltransferase family 2 protein, partial [Candidatus Taylorbacteria bacterium]|nr:glycosyltransferase family 2 protein [Candidatus Taylorbacteria bacterium]